jgi:toxin ParE1/3/4
MKIVWSPFAIEDLIAIRAYIAQHNPDAAASVAQRILHAVGFLADHPQMGAPTHRTDVRKLIVPQTPYVIPYRVRDGAIEILEVFDGRQLAPRTDLQKR